VYIQYGDTFCFNKKGDFVGLACNTLAEVEDPKHKPTECTYKRLAANELVEQFVPFIDKEAEWNKHNDRDNGGRLWIWVFNGPTETEPGKGYVVYQKGIDVGTCSHFR
jgi:hypothetical protein